MSINGICKLGHVPPAMIPYPDKMYNPALAATKHITSYYGDIAIDPRFVKEKHLTIIPRRDTLTGKWMWLENSFGE